MKAVSKPDLRRRYRITYTDDGPDSGCPAFTQIVRAHDEEDARQVFEDDPDGDGWRIIKVELAPHPYNRSKT